MANHKSAKKRARQNVGRNARNRSARSAVRTAVKKFRAAAEAGTDKAALEPLFRSAQKLMAMASSKGIYHANTASRTIGKLAHMLQKQSADATAASAPTQKKASAKKSTASKKKTTTQKKAVTKKKATKKK